MGRKKKELLKKESQEREQLRRYDRFLALSDTLTEKVGLTDHIGKALRADKLGKRRVSHQM